jgi:tRNA-binding protein
MESIKVAPIKPSIDPEVFKKVDIRVGTIESVEDVPGSNKLLLLRVDFGDHKRSILAGMKGERENPRDIEGKQSLFIVNFEPRKMMGLLSEGMILDIGYEDGIKPALAMPEREVPNGMRLG